MKVLAFIFKTLYMVTLGRGYLSRYPRKHRDGLLTISYCIYWVLSSRMKLCDMGTRSEVVLFRLDSLLPQYLLAPSIDICQALGWAPRAWFRWREEPTAERGSQRHRGGRRGGGGGLGGVWNSSFTGLVQGSHTRHFSAQTPCFPREFPGFPVNTLFIQKSEKWGLACVSQPGRERARAPPPVRTQMQEAITCSSWLLPLHANHREFLQLQASLSVALVLGVWTWSSCFHEIWNCPFWVDTNSQITKDLIIIIFNSMFIWIAGDPRPFHSFSPTVWLWTNYLLILGVSVLPLASGS